MNPFATPLDQSTVAFSTQDRFLRLMEGATFSDNSERIYPPNELILSFEACRKLETHLAAHIDAVNNCTVAKATPSQLSDVTDKLTALTAFLAIIQTEDEATQLVRLAGLDLSHYQPTKL